MDALMVTALMAGFPGAPAGIVEVPVDVLGKIAAHAAGIAAAIRLLIRLARSPLFAFLWNKLPMPARLIVLVGLGVVAALFEALAMGKSWPEAFFIALGGLGAAIASHEVQARVLPSSKK